MDVHEKDIENVNAIMDDFETAIDDMTQKHGDVPMVVFLAAFGAVAAKTIGNGLSSSKLRDEDVMRYLQTFHDKCADAYKEEQSKTLVTNPNLN
jgi:hypothetical protein